MTTFVMVIGVLFGTKNDRKIKRFLVPEPIKGVAYLGTQFFRMNFKLALSLSKNSISLRILLNTHTRLSI